MFHVWRTFPRGIGSIHTFGLAFSSNVVERMVLSLLHSFGRKHFQWETHLSVIRTGSESVGLQVARAVKVNLYIWERAGVQFCFKFRHTEAQSTLFFSKAYYRCLHDQP
jgi:hypothetical protein